MKPSPIITVGVWIDVMKHKCQRRAMKQFLSILLKRNTNPLHQK